MSSSSVWQTLLVPAPCLFFYRTSVYALWLHFEVFIVCILPVCTSEHKPTLSKPAQLHVGTRGGAIRREDIAWFDLDTLNENLVWEHWNFFEATLAIGRHWVSEITGLWPTSHTNGFVISIRSLSRRHV